MFHFEDSIDAFNGDIGLLGAVEEERRIEAVIDSDIDLPTATAGGVDDEGAGGSVAFGKLAVEEVDPVALGCGSAGSWV